MAATYCYWISNAQTVQQIYTITVTAVATGGVLSAQISNKIISYTCLNTDTTDTAAAAWQALLSAASAPSEFADLTYTTNDNVITAAAAAAGTPTTIAVSATGGAAVSLVETQANESPSDILNPQNYLRDGSNVLPQAGDILVLQGANTAPLLWNLDGLAAVGIVGVQRWQSFAGTVGLPDYNAGGYLEYRPKYLQLGLDETSSSSPGPEPALALVLGINPASGGGPSRERYDAGIRQTALTVMASGAAADDFAVTFLGTNAQNAILLQSASLGVAMSPGEAAALNSVTVNGGGIFAAGVGVSIGGTATINSAGQATLYCTASYLAVQNGGQAAIAEDGLTWSQINVQDTSILTWYCGGTVNDLTLQTASSMDKSQDLRPLTIVAAEIDATCIVNDPNSTIVWPTSPAGVLVNGQVQAGWLQTGPGREWNVR